MNNNSKQDYLNSVDEDLLKYIELVLDGKDVKPITVGFVNDRMCSEIKSLTGLSTYGNRIVLGADDVRHIIKRHGPSGLADHSMKDNRDIARLCYVVSNYDSLEWDGGRSRLYRTSDGDFAPQIILKKRVNGTYYVIEVVSDSKKHRNVVTTAYLKKADS